MSNLTHLPLLSVIIRTYNSWATTSQILALLNDPRCERILVDSGSDDLPGDIDTRVEKVICSPQPFSYGGSLNAGVSSARAAWIWVLSSHCIPTQRDVLAQIARLLATIPPEVVCILGSTIPPGRRPEEAPPGEPSYSLVPGFDFPGGNPNCLYRTASLRQRPFDERLLTCEDIEWFIAAKDSGALVAASRSFPVLYHTQRSVCVMFRKGLNEYRVGKYLGKPRPKLGLGLFKRLARNFAKVLLRRLSWNDFLRKESYIVGWFCAENFLRPCTGTDIRRPEAETNTPAATTDLPATKTAIPAVRARTRAASFR